MGDARRSGGGTGLNAAASTPAARRLLIALLFVAVALNYVDRQVLALLKPTLETTFHWSDQDFAHLGFTFQIGAAVAVAFAGWFVDRVGVRIALGLGVAVWSLAGMAHALASTVQQFVVARVVLAAAESVGTPAAVKSAAVYLPLKERSFALGLGNTAPNIGNIVVPLLIPPFALAFGWRAAFLVTGALGFLWLAAWVAGTRALVPVPRDGHAVAEAARVSHGAYCCPTAGPGRSSAPSCSATRPGSSCCSGSRTSSTGCSAWGRRSLGGPVALIYTMAALGALTSGMLVPASGIARLDGERGAQGLDAVLRLDHRRDAAGAARRDAVAGGAGDRRRRCSRTRASRPTSSALPPTSYRPRASAPSSPAGLSAATSRARC